MGAPRSIPSLHVYRYPYASFIEEVEAGGRYRLGPRLSCLAATMHKREFSDLARDTVRSDGSRHRADQRPPTCIVLQDLGRVGNTTDPASDLDRASEVGATH